MFISILFDVSLGESRGAGHVRIFAPPAEVHHIAAFLGAFDGEPEEPEAVLRKALVRGVLGKAVEDLAVLPFAADQGEVFPLSVLQLVISSAAAAALLSPGGACPKLHKRQSSVDHGAHGDGGPDVS